MNGYTIDSASSKDLDDAVWVERTDTGYRVWAHIADVANAVPKDSTVNQQAFELVETQYYGKSHSKPMLPRRISENECSLLEGQKRGVLTMSVDLSENLKPDPVISLQVRQDFSSLKKLAYRDVPTILKDESHALHEQLKLAESVARGLMQRRRNAGALVLYDISHGWVTTEEGFVRQIKDTEDTIGQIIVQELMILVNTQLAAYSAEREIPLLWRNHTARAHAPERQDLVTQLATASVFSTEALETLRKTFHMIVNRAEYGSTLRGHYGLNLPAYLHITSPIRRFADLVNQRQLMALVHKEPYPYSRDELGEIAAHINETSHAVKSQRSKDEIQRVARKAQRHLDAGQISHLEGRSYERVVKVLVRSGDFHTGFAEDFKTRLREGRAALLDVYFVLLQSDRDSEEWASLRKHVFEWLRRHLHHAPSILSIAGPLSEWSDPTYDVKRQGPDHATQHTATITIKRKGKGQPDLKGEGVGTSVKTARRRAALDLLAGLLGFEKPSYSSPPPLPHEPPAQKILANGQNAVSALTELCQERKVPLPVYDAKRVGGPDHAPHFVVTVQALGETATSDPQTNKKAAKKEAAAKLLQQVGAERG